MTRRRKFVSEVNELIDNNSNLVQVNIVCKKPYTYAKVRITDPDSIYGFVSGHGFSKVMAPDAWNAEFGRKLAVSRAIGDAWDSVH